MTKSKYTENLNSPAKKIMRVLVYDEAKNRFAKVGEDAGRVLLLPGRIPKQEIALAKTFLKAHVTAIDPDSVAVEAARTCGADDVIIGKVQEIATDLRFGFVNLDTCVSVTNEWVGEAIGRVSFLAPLVTTWFSYGREDPRYRLTQVDRYRIEKQFGGIDELPEKLRNRICFAWQRALWSSSGMKTIDRKMAMRLLKVWVYTHGVSGARMFAALWATDRRFYNSGGSRVRTVQVHPKMFETSINDFSATLGRDEALRLFDCTPGQLAAWRAVQTQRLNREKKRKMIECPPATL
jgi:hypothetical protein